MAKLKVKRSVRRENMTAEDLKQEKKFFKIAILVTIVLIVLIYLIYNNA
ncbi:MAG: hypothetical protein IPM42_18035 [Saprospiraceae bacterium]|nr:hypothetical protein [Saprospiraceae bacterium]